MEGTNHTFAVCAYKESPYLEDCIRSLLRQSVKTNIIITTSTPCAHIRCMADKYKIPLYIRKGKSDIRDDWNFAYNKAQTGWVTVAHQDDMYGADYVKEFLDAVSGCGSPVAFFSDYMPVKKGRAGRDCNARIRRFLRIPMKYQAFAKRRFWKKAVLSFGNSICAPSVAYHKERLGKSYFTSEMKFNIDWDTFLKLAEEEGAFVYTDKPLTFYRIHGEATSMAFIKSHQREREDAAMFRKFWPGWVTAILMRFYKKAYDTYKH